MKSILKIIILNKIKLIEIFFVYVPEIQFKSQIRKKKHLNMSHPFSSKYKL